MHREQALKANKDSTHCLEGKHACEFVSEVVQLATYNTPTQVKAGATEHGIQTWHQKLSSYAVTHD